jgi:hypothetical protein
VVAGVCVILQSGSVAFTLSRRFLRPHIFDVRVSKSPFP